MLRYFVFVKSVADRNRIIRSCGPMTDAKQAKKVLHDMRSSYYDDPNVMVVGRVIGDYPREEA